MKFDRKKILDRIRKLLRMADDVSSPNEAAIAARRAMHLMTEHNLSNADVVTAGMTAEDFEAHHHGPAYRAFPLHLSSLAVGVARYTDCRARFDWKAGTVLKQIVFEGEVGDLEVCKYLWTYLSRTVDRLCKRSGVTYVGPRTSFKKGCVHEICNTLARMKREDAATDKVESDGKSVILLDKKELMMNTKFGLVKYSKGRQSVSDGRAYEAGGEAGRGVSIRKGVNDASNTRRLK